MILMGKRALVTGASRGIGASIAKALAAEGADVAITYEKSADSAAEVVASIRAKGRKAVAIQADSADVAAVQASVEKTVGALGGLDILVNNAGILRIGELKDISFADIDALLNVNVRAQIIAAKRRSPISARAAASSTSAAISPIAFRRRCSASMRRRNRRWLRSQKDWRGSSGPRRSRSISCSRARSTPT
jgi:NAD(P)-dependent dehydrogenase (short-subunit alcohol dehydrogenase family)